jgi:uridine kinase
MTCFIIGISSPSGGGKTAVVQRLAAMTPHSLALYFDEYDDIAEGANIHPASLRQRILDGADYNAWQMPGLIRDLERLKHGQAIQSLIDGTAIPPQPLVFLDAALGRANASLRPYLDLMVYIDTPLDVAMARRIQRDYFGSHPTDAQATLDQIHAMTAAYLEWARQAYLAMDRQVKPRCDLVLDGCLPVDVLAQRIMAEIEEGPIALG